jgi:hypothetical protein
VPKYAYIEKDFKPDTLKVIRLVDQICREYANQGFILTLRQVFYQMVSRGYLRNSQREYSRLGDIISDGRLAEMIDWLHLEDRTRFVRSIGHLETPEEAIQLAESSYRRDKWKDQSYRPEVWIEKDALVGVIEGVCGTNDVPYFSCRGYVSQSEMWSAGQRLLDYIHAGQIPIIFHLGDHDPSGIDMTRDIQERITMFTGGGFEIQRIALNLRQIRQFNPPPNPAKVTDSRYEDYRRKFGEESWELDALNPPQLVALIEGAIRSVRDEAKWRAALAVEREHRTLLRTVSQKWGTIVKFLPHLR